MGAPMTIASAARMVGDQAFVRAISSRKGPASPPGAALSGQHDVAGQVGDRIGGQVTVG